MLESTGKKSLGSELPHREWTFSFLLFVLPWPSAVVWCPLTTDVCFSDCHTAMTKIHKDTRKGEEGYCCFRKAQLSMTWIHMVDSPVCWNRSILSVLWTWQGLQESKQDRKQRAPLETHGIASKGRPLVSHRRQPDTPTSEELQPPQTTAPVWEQVLRRWVCDGDLNSKHNRGWSSKASHSWKHSKGPNQNYIPYVVRYS